MQGTALPLDLDFLNEKYHWLQNGLRFYNSAWGKHTERLKYIKAGSVHRANRVREVCLHKSNPGQWHPTPVLLPGKSHGQRSLVGCSPWGHEESDTTEQLHFHYHFHALEKEMATHSSVLPWRIPGTGEPDGLPSMGSHRVRHN